MNPERNINVPESAQWLSGSVGSWFFIEAKENQYQIKRFSREGMLECDRLFTVDNNAFDISVNYQFTFLSHCKECTIIQNEITYKFYTNEY
jgi:hypothetical protein